MIRQSSSAGPCKYLRNYYKKSYVKFLQNKERKKKYSAILNRMMSKITFLRGCSSDIASSYFFRPSKVWSMLHYGSVGASPE